jgi:hypothetical protein
VSILANDFDTFQRPVDAFDTSPDGSKAWYALAANRCRFCHNAFHGVYGAISFNPVEPVKWKKRPGPRILERKLGGRRPDADSRRVCRQGITSEERY